jgi:hypothetical protein
MPKRLGPPASAKASLRPTIEGHTRKAATPMAIHWLHLNFFAAVHAMKMGRNWKTPSPMELSTT